MERPTVKDIYQDEFSLRLCVFDENVSVDRRQYTTGFMQTIWRNTKYLNWVVNVPFKTYIVSQISRSVSTCVSHLLVVTPIGMTFQMHWIPNLMQTSAKAIPHVIHLLLNGKNT